MRRGYHLWTQIYNSPFFDVFERGDVVLGGRGSFFTKRGGFGKSAPFGTNNRNFH